MAIMRRRWWLLLIAFPLYTAVMWWFGSAVFLFLAYPPSEWDGALPQLISPRDWVNDALCEDEWWVFVGGPVVALAATQALFLLPIGWRGFRRSNSGTSLRFSVAVAGVVAAVLTVAFGFAAWNLLHFLEFRFGYTLNPEFELELRDVHLWVVLAIVAVSWVIWSVILLAFARRKPDHWVGTRLLGLLLGGTIIEVIIVIPLDIMVRRKSDCYCTTGTFISLCMSAWALLWLAGPGVIIAVLSKRRRLWWDTNCANCGYEKGPSPGDRCPECGFEWAITKGAKPQAADL